MQRMSYNNKFSSYIDCACSQVFSSFFQWFAHKSAVWYHLQKHLCSVNHWCYCMSSEALLCRTNRKWEIEEILVIFQQILTFFWFQYLITLESKFCLLWIFILILSAVLIFFWLITHVSFCCTSLDHRFLWYSKTVIRSHDLHFVRFYKLD